MNTDELLEILDCLPNPVMVVASDFRILGANLAALNLYGTELRNQFLYAVMRQPNALTCIKSAQDSGKVQETTISELSQQSETLLRLIVKPVNLPTFLDRGMVVSLIDITEFSEVERFRRDFVANVSHELRSPITAISGFVETLMSSAWDDEATRLRFLRIMEEEARRMSRLVSDLLSLSKVEASERMLPSERVDICEVLLSTMDSLRLLPMDMVSRIRYEPLADRVEVTGDWDQLKQVFYNLIENGLKYSPENSPVCIKCSRQPSGVAASKANLVRVDVIDTGTGIDAVHLPRLTERFYRVDRHRSRKLGGTGLGLAIVKHIVNRHRGWLKINSEVGVGSTFSVELPVSSD